MMNGTPIIKVTPLNNGHADINHKMKVNASTIFEVRNEGAYTRLFVNESIGGGMTLRIYDVAETPQEIGKLITEEMKANGNE